MSDAPQAYLLGAVRTPHGRYGGTLREVPVVRLGALAAAEAVRRAGIAPSAVDEVVASNCRQAGNGPNPGRQMTLRAGFAERVPAQTINMACASGLKAIALAHQQVTSGQADVVVAVAAESMSTMPYIASGALRWGGVRRGDIVLHDGWRDGGTDPICDMNMGQTAELVAERYGIERADQDEWAARSHRRLARAWQGGELDDEVMAIELDDDAGTTFARDETFRADSSVDKLARLKPSFQRDGTVTAGNASQMADGAAAVVVASADAVRTHGLAPMGTLRSFAAVGVDPKVMGIGPVEAIPLALERAGVTAGDVDRFEINEAFASQIVHNVRALQLPEERVNPSGGGIALGHPTGQTGCRLVVSLLHGLARSEQMLGVASLCVGGGQGVAAVIERVAA